VALPYSGNFAAQLLVKRNKFVYNENKNGKVIIMSYEEKATALHESGCNCCQAVLGAVCEKFNMDPDTAYRLGAFFNAGMRRGEVCGAVCGALMALGLEYGDENNRKNTKSIAFMKQFQEEYGSLHCKELLGEDGKKKKELCPVLIKYCADYLEKEFAE
jgi:C_GCAxxG_C_C family probable redox protein